MKKIYNRFKNPDKSPIKSFCTYITNVHYKCTLQRVTHKGRDCKDDRKLLKCDDLKLKLYILP